MASKKKRSPLRKCAGVGAKGRIKKGWRWPGGGKCPVKAKGGGAKKSKARRSRPKRRKLRRGMSTVQLLRRSRTSPRRRSRSSPASVFETNPGAAAAAYRPEGIMGAFGRRRRVKRRRR